jgi:signal transduction histidine kinase
MGKTPENNEFKDWEEQICKLSKEGLSFSVGVFSIDGTLLEANPAMCYFLKADPKELIPKHLFINPEFKTLIQEEKENPVFEGLMTIGNYTDVSFVLNSKVYRKGNRILIYAEINVPELIEENNKMGILNQEVNNLQRQLIKEKKNLQSTLAELKKLNDELSELNLEKNRYIGMVAHDLRNPIGIAESFSEILIESLDNFPKDTQFEYLRHINDSCSFSLNLIRDFLDTSKIEAGIFDLNLNDQEYLSFVKNNILQNHILAQKKFQQIIINTNCDAVVTTFDKNKIQQVLNNLLSNAINYSAESTTIVIDISRKDDAIVTKITDQGQGIPENELTKLFQPFQTTSVKPTANEKTTGLGLAIVKKIVEAHNGTIKVESNVGVGSTFIFTLPIC